MARIALLRTPLCVLILFLCVSCAGVTKTPDIAALINQPADTTPFMAVGSLTVYGGGAGFSGWAHLSMDGDNFRLEALDAMNRAVLAVAGEPGRMVKVDPRTGERRHMTSPEIIAPEFGGVTPPPALLRSAVTGEVPRFGRAVSTSLFFGKSHVVTEDPEMELVFDGRLVEARMRSGDEGVVTLRLGPVDGTAGHRTIEWSEISFSSGATLMIRWKKVTPVQGFPAGFFTFSESEDDF